MKNLQERRKNPRLNANFVVSYRIKEIPDNYDLTQTKNVSSGGLLLTTNRKFQPGTTLAITIRFPFTSSRIELDGEVVDSQEIVKGLIYDTRMKFKSVDENLLFEIAEFINKKLNP